MASGIKGNYIIECGNGFSLRVRYHEDYSTANNYSNFYIDGIDVKSTTYTDDYYPDGVIKLDGSVIYTMDSRTPTGHVGIRLRNEWFEVSNTSCVKKSITHKTDGTKTISVQLTGNRYTNFSFWRIQGSGNANGWGITNTKSIVLTSIPRASQPSCITYPENTEKVGNIGTSFVIHMNRAASIFTHTVKYKFGNASGTIGTDVGSYVRWTMPMSLCNQIPNSVSGSGTITVETYSGTTKIGTKTCTFIASVPPDIKPTIDSLDAILDNSENGIIDGWGIAVAGYTKIKFTGNASGAYKSTITSYTISGAYSITQTGSVLDYTGSKITSSGQKSFDVIATDSRGRKSAKVNIKVTYFPYSAPTIMNFVAMRETDNALSVSVSKSVNYSSVNGNNNITLTLKYKRHTSTGWTTYGVVPNDGMTLLQDVIFSEASSYDFQLTAKDSVGKSAIATFMVPTSSVLMDFRAGGKGLGIGKIAETDALEIALDVIFSGEITYKNDNWISVDAYESEAIITPQNVVSPLRYRKIGNRVTIMGTVGTNSSFNGSEVVFTLPEGFRPLYRVNAINPASGKRMARIFVSPSGNVYIEWIVNISDSQQQVEIQWVDLSIDFYTD